MKFTTITQELIEWGWKAGITGTNVTGWKMIFLTMTNGKATTYSTLWIIIPNQLNGTFFIYGFKTVAPDGLA
jgi:hypothetical protein